MNLYTLHNDTLTVALDACGAVLHSIIRTRRMGSSFFILFSLPFLS